MVVYYIIINNNTYFQAKLTGIYFILYNKHLKPYVSIIKNVEYFFLIAIFFIMYTFSVQ